MCMAYLWCLLLVCFPGVLYAQSAAQSCPAPSLDGGYLVPKQETYNHGDKLTYSCDNTHKPAVEGWWAGSMCQNGTWIPEPRCIDVKACLPLKIKNAEYTENSKVWYEDGGKVGIKCDEGYDVLNQYTTAVCKDGTWTSVPVCQLRTDACEAPPQIPHAVVVGMKYKEVFAAESLVQYECEAGYTVKGEESTKTITCLSGSWTDGPTCSKIPATEHGPTGGGHSSSAGSELQRLPVRKCGTRPQIRHGEVVRDDDWFLEYHCNDFYTLVGEDTVKCYSDGSWSQIPTCADTYCSLNTDDFEDLVPVGVVFLKHLEEKRLRCTDVHMYDNFSVAKCTNKTLTRTECLNRLQIWGSSLFG